MLGWLDLRLLGPIWWHNHILWLNSDKTGNKCRSGNKIEFLALGFSTIWETFNLFLTLKVVLKPFWNLASIYCIFHQDTWLNQCTNLYCTFYLNFDSSCFHVFSYDHWNPLGSFTEDMDKLFNFSEIQKCKEI